MVSVDSIADRGQHDAQLSPRVRDADTSADARGNEHREQLADHDADRRLAQNRPVDDIEYDERGNACHKNRRRKTTAAFIQQGVDSRLFERDNVLIGARYHQRDSRSARQIRRGSRAEGIEDRVRSGRHGRPTLPSRSPRCNPHRQRLPTPAMAVAAIPAAKFSKAHMTTLSTLRMISFVHRHDEDGNAVRLELRHHVSSTDMRFRLRETHSAISRRLRAWHAACRGEWLKARRQIQSFGRAAKTRCTCALLYAAHRASTMECKQAACGSANADRLNDPLQMLRHWAEAAPRHSVHDPRERNAEVRFGELNRCERVAADGLQTQAL